MIQKSDCQQTLNQRASEMQNNDYIDYMIAQNYWDGEMLHLK